MKRLSWFLCLFCLLMAGCKIGGSGNSGYEEPEFSGLEVYPGPGNGVYQSPLYKVEVWDGEQWIDSYTYHVARTSYTYWPLTDNLWGNLGTGSAISPSVNFTTFGTNANKMVRVSLPGGGSIDNIAISPKNKQINTELRNGTAVFTLSKLDKVWIMINGDDNNPLFICADPPKPNVPQGAVYFGPGVHDIGRLFRPKDGQAVYLDGGAWVRGTIDIRNLNNIRIMGPGVLSGENMIGDWPDSVHGPDYQETLKYVMILGFMHPENSGLRLEGITIVDTPTYCMHGLNTVRNVKLFSPWRYSTDGFQVVPDAKTRQGLIENCLAFVGDDVFFPRENRNGNITIRNCVVGGTIGSIFNISYGDYGGGLNDMDNKYVSMAENIDVVKPYSNPAIFLATVSGAKSSSGKAVQNQTYKDIRIEGNTKVPLIDIENRVHDYGGDPAYTYGNVRNIQFINVSLEGSQGSKSRLTGWDSENNHSGYVFKNVSIGGTVLTQDNFSSFVTTNEFVSNITIQH